MYQNIMNLSAMQMPLAFLALFKHFQYNKVVSKLWQAVAVAASVLGSYFFIFFVIFFGFTLMAYFTFGPTISRFSDPISAFVETYQMVRKGGGGREVEERWRRRRGRKEER
jgi:general stress protein CsbA